ncbi:uncharacterized protein Dana_GF17281 [Drosophila ananassae]|uniref:DUF4773 domain-containing protein n=1 Tax=Drosophila ananassae TaxID=7217 RepID=B3LYZ8_DROAN|nr:uncharacterized protein LOC6500066 [Drosophila ananassae]EDV41872.1 uncharacterized protein Dana_GF17281 [Drosophila ananassae]
MLLQNISRLIFLVQTVWTVSFVEAQFYYPGTFNYPPTQAPVPAAASAPRFVLFNPFSGQQFEPFRYTAFLRRGNRKPQVSGNIVELPQLWQPCSCAEFACRCCLGLVFGFGEAYNQRVCAAIEYNRADVGLRLSVELNQRSVANFGFSARNPPDYCVPLLLPLPLFSCLRLYDIRAFGEGNVQVCLSVVFKVLVSQFFEYRFNCLRFGPNGVFFVRDTVQQDSDAQELDKQVDRPASAAPEVNKRRVNLPNDKLAAGNSLGYYGS